MSHSYVSSLYHCVFSTKNRVPTITPDLQARLWPYLGGIARENNFKALSVGGIENHVHVLLSLPAKLSLAHAVQLIKGGSSKWIHDSFPALRSFAWQEGYGAFSIGISQVPTTTVYIQNQKAHHGQKTFEQEFLAFLRKHELAYDPRYVWG